MSIAGVTESLVRLLQAQLQVSPEGDQWTVLGLTPRDIVGDCPRRIAWLLWRVDADPAPHNTLRTAPPAPPAQPVTLHYLLLVRGKRTEDEQDMLSGCIAALAATPVLAGMQLAPGHTWPDGTALHVGISQVDTGALLDLWRSLAVPLQLSVPYVVRGLNLAS
jgi:hypothetical protein